MKSAAEIVVARRYHNLKMRLAGVLSILNVHSWSDYALNLAHSAANIIGAVAAAVVLIAIVFIYFTGSELNQRARGNIVIPRRDQTKALRQSRAELAAVRRDQEAKTLRLSKAEKELAAAKRSEESMASRLSQIQRDLEAARRATEEKASRLSQVEAELAIVRHSAEEARATPRPSGQRQALRKITPEQRTQFLNAVRGLPTGKVIVSALFDNKDAHDFGTEILGLLREAGFEGVQPTPINFFTASRPSSGVRIGCEDISNPPPHFATVQAGLRAIGLEAPTTTLINAREGDVVEIQVTPKP